MKLATGLFIISGLALSATSVWVVAPREPPRVDTPIRLAERLDLATRITTDTRALAPIVLLDVKDPPHTPSPWRFEVAARRHVAYTIEANVFDPRKATRLFVENETPDRSKFPPLPPTDPAADEPDGWERADTYYTDTVSDLWYIGDDRRTDLPLRFTIVTKPGPGADLVRLKRLRVRERGHRDPALEISERVAWNRGLIDRPLDHRGTSLVVDSILATSDSRYEFEIPISTNAVLELFTVEVPRASGPTKPAESLMRIQFGRGKREMAHLVVRPGPDTWKRHVVPIPAGASSLTLESQGPATVAWGASTLWQLPATKRPHVIVVVLDGARRDGLSAYGNPRETTPFIDGLAAQGALLEDAVAPFGQTWEAIGALFSGYHPETHGAFNGRRLPTGQPTVAAAFARAGYRTARIGTPHLPSFLVEGFDIVERPHDVEPCFERLVANFRAARDVSAPVFAWVHLNGVHFPYDPPRAHQRWDRDYTGRFKHVVTRPEFDKIAVHPDRSTPRERAHIISLIDAGYHHIDTTLRRTLERLATEKLVDDLIVVVLGDHGTHLGEQNLWFVFGTPNLASLRVPAVIYAPGRVRPGTRIKSLSRLVDIGPTLLDLAQIPVPKGLDGISLRPELEGRAGPVRVGMTHHKSIRGLVTPDHLFLEDTGNTILSWPSHNAKAPVDKVQLYDRRTDPFGQKNIAAAHPDIVARLRAALTVLEKGRRHTPTTPLSAEVRRLMRQAGYLPE
ncbi:MAG: sulfatase-like hydrolase/transferase [Deltaproteobacteria bacterium]|nr:sulfatase-like hydrolase/transferase [Deltaproteobacteria bacterium]